MNDSSRSLVEVGISMVLKDNFTREAGRISESFRTMMSDMRAATQGYQGAFGDITELGWNLVGSMYDAYKYAAGVQNEIFLASKIAGANIKEAQELMATAQKVNAETPLTAAQVASAERYLAMAGNSADKIQDLIGPAGKLASIFGMNPGGKGGVADIMTNIMAMFQMDTSNASRVADDIYTAVTNANMSLEDLMATVRYSGADMAAAGVSFRELAAAAGALGDVGIQGTMAGTSLGNMIRYLQLTLAGQKRNGLDTLNELGLSVNDFYDEMGNFKGIGNALQQFLGVYKNMTSIERTQDFYNMLGVRGMRGMIPILEAMAKGNDKFTKIMSRYDENAGAVDETLAQWKQTNQGIIDQFESSMENLRVSFGQASGGPFNFLLSAGTKIVDWANSLIQQGGFGAEVVSKGVGLIITNTVWVTLKGILAFVQSIGNYTKSIQTSVTATAEASVSSRGIMLNGFTAVEQHLMSLNTNVRNIYAIVSRHLGVGVNRQGGFYVSNAANYRKNYGNTSPTGKPIKGGQFLKGSVQGDVAGPMFLAWSQAQGSSGTPGPGTGAGTKLAGSRLLNVFGKLASIGLRLINPLFMIISAIQLIPMLIDGIKWLANALGANTEMHEKDLARRAKDEYDLMAQAIKQGIVEGFRGSNINITSNGEPLGGWTPGTGFDYEGGVLMGL